MLLQQPRVGFLERLKLPISRAAARGGPPGRPPKGAVAYLLPPLGQHEGMDREREATVFT